MSSKEPVPTRSSKHRTSLSHPYHTPPFPAAPPGAVGIFLHFGLTIRPIFLTLLPSCCTGLGGANVISKPPHSDPRPGAASFLQRSFRIFCIKEGILQLNHRNRPLHLLWLLTRRERIAWSASLFLVTGANLAAGRPDLLTLAAAWAVSQPCTLPRRCRAGAAAEDRVQPSLWRNSSAVSRLGRDDPLSWYIAAHGGVVRRDLVPAR